MVETLIFCLFNNEGMNDSAAPAFEGDELDVTPQKQRPEIPQQKGEGKETLTETTSEGLGTAQKLFFIGLIVAVCVAFVKTRKGGRGIKSMA